MRREGRVRGKPTSKSRVTGHCLQGRTRCRYCREFPVEKSMAKRMGRNKRLAVDVRTNPALADFSLQHLPSGLDLQDDDTGVVCAFCELEGENSQGITDIGDVESASASSEASWSEVELTESVEDDWFVVDVVDVSE